MVTTEVNLAFSALSILDEATLFSKEDVLEEYENNKDAENLEELLLNKAVYPNGEKLGFYNISKFTLKDFLEKDPSPEEFGEYFNGFNSEVKSLFYLFKGSFSYFNKWHDYIKRTKFSLKGVDKEYREYIIVYYKAFWLTLLESDYINYVDLSHCLKNILFDNVKLEENVSILHINPENDFIFYCLNHIRNQNKKCNVDLYVISNNPTISFVLKFLDIFFKANLTLIFDDSSHIQDKTYENFFKENNEFDFVINSNMIGYGKNDGSYGQDNLIDMKNFSKYNVNISSRCLYMRKFMSTNFYLKDWFENDFLEGMILIPYKLPQDHASGRRTNLIELIILNYKKNEERINKTILIDNNSNKDITTTEYTKVKITNLVNSNEIFKRTQGHFRNFIETEHSKIFNIEELVSYDYIEDELDIEHKLKLLEEIDDENHAKKLLNDIKFSKEVIALNVNDLIYPNKMKSQKEFYKIGLIEEGQMISKYLDYEIEELGKLTKRIIMRIKNGDVINSENQLFFKNINDYENKKWVFLDYELTNPSLYFPIELTSKKLSLEYLYYFLNSQIGINEHDYFSRGASHFNSMNHLKKIKVPIPPKEIQDKIVEAMNKRDEFLNDVKLLENITNQNFFNYEKNMEAVDEFYGKREYSAETQDLDIPDNWLYTYSGLIWPLAVTYLIASGGYSKTEKYNNLIRLLEFTVAFNSYVLMSGLPDEIYEERKSDIWSIAYTNPKTKDNLKNKLPLGFGNWAHFHGTLAGIYKKEFNTVIDKDFYIKLLDKNIRNTYDNLANERNNYFHGSIKNDEECGTLLNQLNPTKRNIFNYLNSCYKNYRLYYVVKKPEVYEINGGKMTFEYTMMYLNGPYSMPIYTNILSDEVLEYESLYLQDIIENKFTKIDDKLIKFKAIDENHRDWRLYVFIGFEKIDGKKLAKYRCYQRPEDDEYEDIDLNELM